MKGQHYGIGLGPSYSQQTGRTGKIFLS